MCAVLKCGCVLKFNFAAAVFKRNKIPFLVGNKLPAADFRLTVRQTQPSVFLFAANSVEDVFKLRGQRGRGQVRFVCGALQSVLAQMQLAVAVADRQAIERFGRA